MLLDPFNEWYLRKHLRAESFLDTQTVADLKCDREGTEENVKDRGECPKTAHEAELELSGYRRAECLSVPAAD